MKSKSCECCNAECCRYVATEIDKPEKESDFEEIKWFVSHENVHVYVDEDGEWYVEFTTPCKFLGKDNKCTNYENRPKVCKDYDHDECTFYNGSPEVITFNSVEDVERYIEKNGNKDKSKNKIRKTKN